MPYYRAKKDKFTEFFRDLWDILIAAAADPAFGNVICVIDALDECERGSQKILLETLLDFYTNAETAVATESKQSLKFLVTSRPYRGIERLIEARHKVIGNLRLRAEDETDAISQDVEVVVDARVNEIGTLHSISKSTLLGLRRRLLENANGTFLWVSLVLDGLVGGDEVSDYDVQHMLTTLPKGLDEIYHSILEHSSNPHKARKVLNIIIAAIRPLSLEEMNIACAMDTEGQPDLDQKLQPSIENTVKGICGLFVKVVNGHFYLIHQTAREFLLRPSNPDDSQCGLWKHSFDRAESHFVLLRICIRYLLLPIFESDPGPSREDLIALVDQHHFLLYAATHWPTHFVEAGSKQALVQSALQLFASPMRLAV